MTHVSLIPFDHLVLAGPDLSELVDLVESSTGVRATPGGAHAGMGTKNELIGLGPSSYLELIGPDTDQPEPAGPRPFGIDGIVGPQLMTWAVAVGDLEAAQGAVAQAGCEPGRAHAMARVRPDGVRLEWRLTMPPRLPTQGVMPFLIEWGDGTPHPAEGLTSDAGALQVEELSLSHPNPGPISLAIEAVIGMEVVVTNGPVRLAATFRGPKGDLSL